MILSIFDVIPTSYFATGYSSAILQLICSFIKTFTSGSSIPQSWALLNIIGHKICLKVMKPIGDILTNRIVQISNRSQISSELIDFISTLLILLNSKWVQIETYEDAQLIRLAKSINADIRDEGGQVFEKMWNDIDDIQLPLDDLFPFLIESFMELTLSSSDGLRNVGVDLLFKSIKKSAAIKAQH